MRMSASTSFEDDRPGLRQRFLAVPVAEVAMCEVAVGELLVGALKSSLPQTLADTTAFVGRHRRVSVDACATAIYSKTRAFLEAGGQRMDDNDLWIASVALAENAVLITSDLAFSRVPDLKTENWRG